jgi:hypothetical protein
MLKRHTYKLAAAVVAAGAVCALGAASAATASAGPWSGRIGPVPGANTDASPALTAVTFGTSSVTQTLVAWKGDGNAHIWYAASPAIGVHKSWSARAAIPGAASTAAPAIASYRDPNGREAVLAVWRGTGGLINLAQGETEAGQQITWTAVSTLPESIYSTTDAAPAVYFAQDRYAAVVAYRGPHDHIRYIEGFPAGRGFKWSDSFEVSPTAVADSGPAIAEQQTGTARGTLSIFWKDAKTGEVSYASTTDPLAAPGKAVWTFALVPGSATSDNPAASALGLHAAGPLLLTYKAPHGTHIWYQELTSTGWSAAAVVPTTSTVYGPALYRGELATTNATSAGPIYFHLFS